MLARYSKMLERSQPYLVISDLCRQYVSTSPLGIAIPPRNVFNPHDPASAGFLHLIQQLDDLIFVPLGMEMPRWALYDCAQMPGGIFGFAQPARDLPSWVRATMRLCDSYTDLVPLSMFIVIPMLQKGAFLNYSLCSINQGCPGAAPPGLRVVTKTLGLKVFGVERLYATAQWRSPTLAIHTRFGALELLTAYTPAHSLPATLTFRFDVTDERLEYALSDETLEPERALWVDADDIATLRRIQTELEAGAQYRIIGNPIQRGSVVSIPLGRG
jgi:hypothetical protein